MAQKGYLRVSVAAKKIGRDVGYVHRQITHGRFNVADGSALRVDTLWYVHISALSALVGPMVSKMVALASRGANPSSSLALAPSRVSIGVSSGMTLPKREVKEAAPVGPTRIFLPRK